MVNNIKILRASAGSGKTYRLAYEYIKRVILSPDQYSKILAVTFTNKATEEMKNRILSRLNDLSNAKIGDNVDYLDSLMNDCGLDFWQIKENARLAKSYILHDYSNFAVSTIDKFFQRIARSFFKELNLDFNYEVELSQDGYISEAVERVLESSKSDPVLNSLIKNAVNEQLENNSWDIRNRLYKLAEVLTREGYHHPELPARDLIGILAKATDELEMVKAEIIERAREACSAIEAVGLSGSDFAYAKYSFVSQLERMRGGQIKGYNGYFAKAVESRDAWCNKSSANKSLIFSLESVLMPLLPQIKSSVDQYLYLGNGISAVEKNFSIFLLLDYISVELDSLWGENNKLPIFRTTDLIADITNASDAPFIYEKIGSHYNCYMIDEFQDTSNKQWEGFKPLIEEALSSSDIENVMLIGDVKQAIYRWRGGDWNILANEVEHEFLDRVDDSESLTTNRRSHSNVINFNNALFSEILNVEATVLEPHTEHKSLVKSAYKEYQQGVTSKDGGYVEVEFCKDNLAEVLDRLSDLIGKRGYSQKDIAILTRMRVESSEIANLLVNNGYSVVSDEALLIDNSPVVRFMLSLMRLSVDVNDIMSIAQVNFYLGKGMESAFGGTEANIIRKITFCNPIKALEIIITAYDLQSREVAYLQAFYDQVYRFCVGVSGDIGLFIEWWDDHKGTISLAVPKGQDAITIITIHKAKGLQYPIVMVPYADWSLLPNRESKIWANAEDTQLEEMGTLLVNYVKDLGNSPFYENYSKETVYSHIDNLNLLYVALTRAEKELYIFAGVEIKSNSIAELLGASLPGVAGVQRKSLEDGELFWFGSKNQNVAKEIEEGNSVVVTNLTIKNADLKIATRLPHYRIEDEDISNREMGILMHNLFARINVEADFEAQINLMEVNGEISSDMAFRLRDDAKRWLSNDLVKDWYSGTWRVYSERSILSTDSSGRRPDRVLVNGNKAIVIDYKFGLRKTKSHLAQIESYGDLLKQMGYTDVQCHLWYINNNEVVTL